MEELAANVILNDKRLNASPHHKTRKPPNTNQMYFLTVEKYNIKQNLDDYKMVSKIDLCNFLPWNVDNFIKMMDFTPMIMLHLWQKLSCIYN